MLDAFWEFLRWPLDMWQDGDHAIAIVIGILYLIMAAGVVLVLCMIISMIWSKFVWYVKRKPCQHNCGSQTTDIASAGYASCVNGQSCCQDCTVHHKATAEPVYNCPVDGTKMVKVEDDRLVYDRCNTCNHYLLSFDELNALRQRSSDEADSKFATGLTIGIAIG